MKVKKNKFVTFLGVLSSLMFFFLMRGGGGCRHFNKGWYQVLLHALYGLIPPDFNIVLYIKDIHENFSNFNKKYHL
jgi:hypothetical protein